MNIENTNIERESTERPEDEWIERFSSWLVGGLLYRFLPGELGKKVNAVISAVIGYDLKRLISSPPKKFNNLLYDLFYEKQSKEYWNITIEEVYKKILRQTELFGINAKLSNLDINTYLQQWIEGNSKEAIKISAMIETALAHSQKLLGEAKGGDIIDFYKSQVMSLLNWKEIYSRAYASIADQRRNQEIASNTAGSDARQKQIESTKTNVINAPINVTSLPYSISDLDVNEGDFEKGYSLLSGNGIGEFSFSLLPENYGMTDDIMSSFNMPVDFSSLLDESGAFNLPEALVLPSSVGQSAGAGFSLFPGSVGSLDSLFGMGGGISIPVQYEIEVSGLEQFEGIKEKAEEAGEAVEESCDTFSNFSSEMMRQFLELDEEKRAAFSIDLTMLPLNMLGIGGAPFQFSLPVEESKQFSETLSDIAGIAGQLGGAFMNVNENIGRAIGSAGGLAGGISSVLDALKKNPLEGVDTSKMTPEQIEAAREQGEKRKGLAIMGGIQGGFAGLQGLFGGEAGSDTSQLLGGLGGAGAGVAGILTGNPIEGITSLIGSISSLIDGLTESTQEGYVKQLQKQGFNDTYSQDLLDKMSEVSDKMGDKSFGMKAYIEDFFKETNIDTAEEFGRMSDLLNESVGEYVAQGHTMDEAYDKFGDELEQLNEAQEKYGFETVASLDNMLEQQRTQTKEGRIEGLKGALGGYDKIISGLEKQMKLTPDFKLSEASISGIAGSLTNTYQELINQVMGAGEAVEAVKPLLTHYSEMAQQQGWDLSKVPGFSQLSTYFESLDKASGALDMIQGSADVVKALSSSGMMDQTTLQGQESLGLDVMHQLEASGLNETQRLQQMSGWLQAMQQASEKGGLTLSPEVQALISKAEEKGVMPEEEKPVGDVISEGIVAGFEKACGVIDNYFGKLTEYAEGGIIPGAPGGKKLVWAHAGEAIGYPAEIENPAKMLAPLMEPAINGIADLTSALLIVTIDF